jgi:stage V sporulation protein B
MSGEQKKNNSSFLVQGAILAAAGIITRLIGIAYRIPVNNILGDEGQGFYGCAYSIYNIALLLTSYSLPLAVSKLVSARVAKDEHKNAMRIFKSALLFALVVGTLVGMIVFVFSDFIAGNIMSLRLSAYALRVLAPGLLIVAVMGVVRGFFQGMGTMVPTAVSQILEQIVNAIVSVIGASYLLQMGKKAAESQNEPSLPFAYGAAGGTLGTVSGALFGLIFLLVLLKLFYPKFQKRMVRDAMHREERYKEIYTVLLLTIAPVILSTAIYNINDTIDQGIFSSVVISQGYTEKKAASLLGMFTGKYNTLIHIPLAVANSLGASLIPSLTGAVATGNRKAIHAKIQMVIRFAMLIAIPSCIAFMVIPNQILSLLYVGNIEIPAKLLRIGAITVVFYCLSTVTNSILQGLNHMTTPVKHGAISLGVHLVAVVIMLVGFKWNIYSLVVGNIVFSLCMCILNGRALKRYANYRQEIRKTFLLPFAAAFTMGTSLFVSYIGISMLLPKKLATIIAIPIAGCVYVVCLLKFGALTPDEIVALPKGKMLLRVFQRMHLVRKEIE